MNVIIRNVELIERVDQLIEMKATGTPEKLASKLKISKTKLYRTLSIMKELNAPLKYDTSLQSYIYLNEVKFSFGFFQNK